MLEVSKLKFKIDNKDIDIYLNKFNIKKRIYDYHILSMEFEINREKINFFESLINKENVKIYISLNDTKIYSGFLENFKIYNNKEGEYVISIISYSFLRILDRKKEIMFIQDRKFKMKDLISTIMNKYSLEYIIDKNIENIELDSILLEYLETDLEFLKRVFNNYNLFFSELKEGVIYFGIKNTNSKKISELSSNIYKKEFNVYYEYLCEEIYEIFDKINTKTIIKMDIFKEKENIYYKIKSVNIDLFKRKRIYNEKIIGLKIEAKVKEIFSDLEIAKMTVDVNYGVEKIGGIKVENRNYEKFSYQTFYSKKHTGLFLKPEKDDVVEIYFPNYDENYARISWSINNEKSGRFSLDKRNYIFSDNSYIEIDNENIVLNIKDISIVGGNIYIKGKNISNYSKESISNLSEGHIVNESKKFNEVKASSIVIKSDSGDIDIKSRNNVNIKGNKIFNG